MPSDPLVDEIVEFKPRLLAFARSLGTGEDEAEDLVQETYVRAIGARRSPRCCSRRVKELWFFGRPYEMPSP
jgi:DNA-directed RNA polymerase specialized sigma24 family protein